MSQGKPAPSAAELHAFLQDHHGTEVDDVELLAGGHWSSAYGYRTGGRELVLRLGPFPDAFQADRAAMAHAGPDLPVPVVHHVGEALGWHVAISDRHHGRFLEDVPAREAGAALLPLLAAMGRIQGEAGSWRDWLRDGLVDTPERVTHGWRAGIAQDAALERRFVALQARIDALLPDCPERRDLLHADLLHGNVLVAPDRPVIEAVFSWKCSTFGDRLYDVAWCTVWRRDLDLGLAPLVLAEPDGPLRHHCYELQIAAAHLGWFTYTGDLVERQRLADHAAFLLERGPVGQLSAG